jgi:HEPN domain-containing protein
MSQERNEADADRWLAQADADLRAAEDSLKTGHFEWAAFQSQQAAEKAVKSLWFRGGADPWGHSVTQLILLLPAEAGREEMARLIPEAKALDKLYVPTRYPNGLPEMTPAEVYTDREARQAIAGAQAIVDGVRRLRG